MRKLRPRGKSNTCCAAQPGVGWVQVCQPGEGHHPCHTLTVHFGVPLAPRLHSLSGTCLSGICSTLRRSCGHNDGGPPECRLPPDAVICDFLFSCWFYENICFVIPYQLKSMLPREPSNHAFLEALTNEALCLPLFKSYFLCMRLLENAPFTSSALHLCPTKSCPTSKAHFILPQEVVTAGTPSLDGRNGFFQMMVTNTLLVS